jgi:hypothetical protein
MAQRSDLPHFDRSFFEGRERFTRIGEGAIGGKATGLGLMSKLLDEQLEDGRYEGIQIEIPRLTVLATDVFDNFMAINKLDEVAYSGDADDRIANHFQKGELPYEIVGDLRGLIDKVHQPLAVRSSSMLEDAMFEPFAGVYATKMIPNNQPDADTRFRRLVEAIKFVYASTFFAEAQGYIRATGKETAREKMAVIIQEVVGQRHQDRFYPNISGVARSYSFYPVGRAQPEDGVVNLALGLGKTIVDGGLCWTYCPRYPNVDPPTTIGEAIDQSQKEFWAVNMGRPPAFDPIRETEYLVQGSLDDAHMDDTLRFVASTYLPENDRVVPGIGREGPRILNFAPTIRVELQSLNKLIRHLLEMCEKMVGAEVEIEFAITIDPKDTGSVRFGFLQVRPMVVSHEVVEVGESELATENNIVASETVMGNGLNDEIIDIVYVKPEGYEAKYNPVIAGELEKINRALVEQGRPYVLIGFGRWGSSDPWLGIPVNWAQIAGAKVIVESTLEAMNVDLSQGSHFFHNITSFKVFYMSVRHDSQHPVRWEWLGEQEVVGETEHVRHVRAKKALHVAVDGRNGRGVVRV